MKIVKDCDIIHAQLGGVADVCLGAKLATRLKKPLVVTIHGKFGNELEDIFPEERLLNELGKADLLIVNRDGTCNFLKKCGFENILTMYNPIPVNKYRSPYKLKKRQDDKIRVLFIGRLTYRRGAHLSIRGFAHATRNCPNIELSVVGDGPLKAPLASYVEKLGIQKSVIFLGKQLDVRPFLWSSDIFLATSPIANFPSLSLREAMAAGLAVVATDVSETRNLIEPHKTCALVPPNARRIGEAITLLVSDERLCKSLSKAATTYAEENFDIDTYIRKLVTIYRELAKNDFY